jgi:hypothetical protein
MICNLEICTLVIYVNSRLNRNPEQGRTVSFLGLYVLNFRYSAYYELFNL